LGVLDGPPRRFLDNIRQSVLVVVESFVHAPLGGVSLLQTAKRREHLFAEVSRSTALDEHWLPWYVAFEGTARD
jgi:hypothetical protein